MIRAWLVTGSNRKQEVITRRRAWEDQLLDMLRPATNARDKPRIEMQLDRAKTAQPPFECACVDEGKAVVARINAVGTACEWSEAELDTPLPAGDDSRGISSALARLDKLSRRVTRKAPKPYMDMYDDDKRLERLADLLRERRSQLVSLKQRDEARREREAEREREEKARRREAAWREAEREREEQARRREAAWREAERERDLQHQMESARQRFAIQQMEREHELARHRDRLIMHNELRPHPRIVEVRRDEVHPRLLMYNNDSDTDSCSSIITLGSLDDYNTRDLYTVG